jgi:hypothetical protein
MSDYLTSLVQRARGETGVVRPIVQPVFAPERADLPSVPAGTWPGIAGPEIPAPAPRTRAAARPAEAGPLPVPAPLPAEQSGPGDPLSPAPPLSPEANRLYPTPLPPTSGGLQPSPAQQYTVEHPTSANPPLSIALPDSLAGPQTAPSPLQPSRTPAVAPLPTPAVRAGMPAIDPPVQQGTGEPGVRRTGQDAPDFASVTGTQHPTAQVAARRQAGRPPAGEQIIPVPREPDRPAARPATAPAPRRAAADNQAAPPPPPAIRVSIGRIEVRAMLPAPPLPAPIPAPAPSAPLVTLDAYLRERTGRRDR